MHSSPTPLATGLDPAERIRQLEAENRQLRQELSASRTPAEGEKREARQEMGLRSILDHVPAMVGYWDRDLRNRFSNQAYQAWFGIDPAAIMGRHIQEIIGEERYRLNLPYIKGVLRGEAQQFERAIPRPDGKGIRHSLANYIPDIIAGEVQGFYVLVTETTALHDAHEALRASEERYRDVIEDQTELISRLAADGSFIFANQVFCRFFGKTREDLLGQTWAPGCYPEDRPLVEAALSSLSAENPTVVVENRIYSGNGQVYWMQFINRGFFDTSGRLLEIQSVGRDITDRRQAQEALQEAHAQMERRVIERTEQLRRLTIEKALTEERERQSIARDLHDGLGQLLHVAKIKLDGLAKNLPATAVAAAGEVDALLADASRMARSLTSQLSPPVLARLGLPHALRWLAEEMYRLYGLNVIVNCDASCPQLAPAQASILFRSARELLINVAKHAGTGRARLDMACRDGQLILTVADTGRGIANIAETLSTTQGFGLSSLRERLTYLGGECEIISKAGSGLRVSLRMPLRLSSALEGVEQK
jgi:PAS domain S-box-containing protein